MGAVKPVGQLYGSPTALTSQYLPWDRYCTYAVQPLRVERRIFLKQIRPIVAPEPHEGDQSLFIIIIIFIIFIIIIITIIIILVFL